jgi:hypothetical protein
MRRGAPRLRTPSPRPSSLPPQRPSPVVSRQGYGATPQSMGAVSLGPSTGARPATASPASRLSPWSAGKAVATPEQLQQYFDLFASPAARGPEPGSPARASGATGSAYGQGVGGGGGGDGGAGYDQAEGGASPMLPLGRDAPLYRPSIVSDKIGASEVNQTGCCCWHPDARAACLPRRVVARALS